MIARLLSALLHIGKDRPRLPPDMYCRCDECRAAYAANVAAERLARMGGK